MPTLTIDQARRAAVRAQRLDRRRNTAPLSLLRQLGAVQIDSVNVVARAHYLPFFARLDGGSWAHETVDTPDPQAGGYHQLAHMGLLPDLIAQIEQRLQGPRSPGSPPRPA